MAGGIGWRYAVVTRAQTIARGTRMIDLALEGRLPKIAPHSRTDIAIAIGDASVTRTFDCIPAPNGQIRVTVGSGDDKGLRFMWSLVEGAVVRMTVPESRLAHAAGLEFGQTSDQSHFRFPILAVEDAIILVKDSGEAATHGVAAYSSVI